MLKRLGQIGAAFGLAFMIFILGPGKLFGLGPIASDPSEIIVLCIAILSLGTPKRFMWLTLTFWAFYFGWWTLYELTWLQSGDDKFGPMLIPYGIGAFVFAAAALLSYFGKGGTVHFRERPIHRPDSGKAN